MGLLLFATDANDYTISGLLSSAVIALAGALVYLFRLYRQDVRDLIDKQEVEMEKRDKALTDFGDKMTAALADMGRRLTDIEKATAAARH